MHELKESVEHPTGAPSCWLGCIACLPIPPCLQANAARMALAPGLVSRLWLYAVRPAWRSCAACSGVSMPSVVHTSMPRPRMRLHGQEKPQYQGLLGFREGSSLAWVHDNRQRSTALTAALRSPSNTEQASNQACVACMCVWHAHPTISSTRSHWPLPTCGQQVL